MQDIPPEVGVRQEASGFRSEHKRTGTAPETCGGCPSRAACPASAPPAISGTLMIGGWVLVDKWNVPPYTPEAAKAISKGRLG